MKSKMLMNSHLKKEPRKTHMIPTLCFAVVTSLCAALLFVSDLDWEERVTWKRGLVLSVFGLVFFAGLYNLIIQAVQRTYAGQKLIKKYRLTGADVLDFSNKVVSSAQAVLSCVTGTVICSYSCPRDLLRTSHYISQAYAWFGASYFMYDIWSMYQVHSYTVGGALCQQNGEAKKRNGGGLNKFVHYLRQNPIIVGHHLFIGLFGFSVIVYLKGPLGDCVFGFVYLMEASTPFVSLRGILSRFGLKTSKVYVINGLVMLVSFFLCRLIMFPYVMHLYAQATQLDYISAMASLPRGCKLTMLILILPQIYWFFLMLRGATQMLRKPKVSSNGTSTANNTKKKKHGHWTS